MGLRLVQTEEPAQCRTPAYVPRDLEDHNAQVNISVNNRNSPHKFNKKIILS